MAHSIELLFDADTDAAIRRDWAALTEAGLPSQGRHRSPTNRPHVTLTVSGRIDADADEPLGAVTARLPLGCRVGAPMLFGSARLTLVRLIVPSADLLALHRIVDDVCGPFLASGPYPHTRPGRWTPHVTLCRGLAPADLGAAVAAIGTGEVAGTFSALRRWDGDRRVEHRLPQTG